MKCPFCACDDDKVLETRTVDDGARLKRRRECLVCGRRFITNEYVDEITVKVRKKDGRRQPFDLNKVLKGMVLACEKRPVSKELLEEKAMSIRRRIYDMGVREIAAEEVGSLVADALKKIDTVAYVRFASIYRHFKSSEDFIDAVKDLPSQTHPEEEKKP